MAILRNVDGSLRSGKMSKKSKEIHRVRDGREQVYVIENAHEGPASKAQKVHRSLFGKTNAVVNRIMNDPQQVSEWRERMEEYNRSITPGLPPFPKRFITVRQFVFASVSEQIKLKPSTRRRKADLPIVLPRGVRLQVKAFTDLTTGELYEILKARFTVFVGEQHIHYVDEDNIDYLATHFSLRRRSRVIAYARLYSDAEEGVLRVGRMLTIERNQGFAKYLMEQIIVEAKRQGASRLRLHAQTQAASFYEHLGFQPVGNIFTEAEIPHVCMEKGL